MAVYIKQIKIKNFRSIDILDLKVNSQMNIFVGLNDAGKSNVLKALNLFFNNETDYGRAFNFDTDFCNFAKVPAKTAKEISISILLHGDGFIVEEMWFTRKWRKDTKTLPQYEHKKERLCRLPAALDQMKYHYIPAVKGSSIFKTLLSQLYSAIPQKENNTLISSAQKFSKNIEEYTKSLTRNIHDNIGVESVINIPEDMQKMFEALTFNTKFNDSGVDLDFRGDGIKARHIPSLLKFISESQRDADHKGKVNTNIVWGYEEPENGVEMSKCFDMAKEFISYSDEFQMFITTHSLGFYSLSEDMNVALQKSVDVFFVTKNGLATHITPNTGGDLNEMMGIMPLVTPYIRDKIAEMEIMKEKLNKYKETKTVFVSGYTDEQYLKGANELFKILPDDIVIKNIGDGQNKNNRGGDNALDNCRKALPYLNNNNNKFLFIYDCDAQVKDANNVIHLKKRIEAPKYKIGIENLLVLPDNFNYNDYYQLENPGNYGEERQVLAKNRLCNALLALPEPDKRQVFRHFEAVLQEIVTKMNKL